MTDTPPVRRSPVPPSECNLWKAFELIGDDETTDYGTREVDGQIMRIDRVRPTPLTISVHVTLWRLAASIGVETVRPWAGQFGYVASLGGRF